jgi:hypothetical protein
MKKADPSCWYGCASDQDRTQSSLGFCCMCVTTIHHLVREKEEADVEFGSVVSIAGVFAKGRNPNDGCMGSSTSYHGMVSVSSCGTGFHYSLNRTTKHF